jgi:hypothetical protein
LVETLARAVHFAHHCGIVHRDLKPANVLLTSEGQPKIADFGLVKNLRSNDNLDPPDAIMGTPRYMSPEHVTAPDRVDGRGDVYGLGVMLYELLTGETPFRGQTAQLVLQQVVRDESRPPRQLNDAIPADLEAICLKCLEKQPNHRYASAQDMAEDLRRFLAGEPIQARPLTARQRLNRWIRKRPGAAVCRGSVGCLLLGLLVIGLYFGRPEFGTILISVGASTLIGVVSTKLRPLITPLIISSCMSLASIFSVPFRVDKESSLKEPLIEGQERLLILTNKATDLVDWVPDWLTAGSNSLLIILCLLPLLCGIVIGMFSSTRNRAAGLCLLFLILLSTFSERYRSPILVGIAAGAYYGLFSRLVRWCYSGDIVDIIFGSLLGSIVGLFGMSIVYGCIALTFLWDRPVADLTWTVILLIYVGLILSILFGTALGGILGAVDGRKVTLRMGA